MGDQSADQAPPTMRKEILGSSSSDLEKTSDGTPNSNPEAESTIDAKPNEKRVVQETGSAIPTRPSSSIRSRTSRRSAAEEASEGDSDIPNSAEKAFRAEAEEEGLIRRTPLYRSPIPERADRWHEEVDTPSQWTSLFYGKSTSSI